MSYLVAAENYTESLFSKALHCCAGSDITDISSACNCPTLKENSNPHANVHVLESSLQIVKLSNSSLL